MTTAAVFPGQGSQKVGMGRELAREFEAARRVYEEADDALGMSMSTLCFEGPAEALTLTENTQPAILTTSIAALRAAEAEKGFRFDFAAGHSLGELSALVAAGALAFADAVRLVRLRGKAMQAAVPPGVGGMAALLGLDLAAVREVCDEAAGEDVCAPANLNGAGQIVISGHAGAVERALPLAKARGAKRAMMLPVSAPFHCSLMQPAAEALAEALAGLKVAAPAVPVVANATAEPYRDEERVAELLVAQVTSPVRWADSVHRLSEGGVTRAVEFGAGAVLSGLIRRIRKEIAVAAVGTPEQVRSLEVEG